MRVEHSSARSIEMRIFTSSLLISACAVLLLFFFLLGSAEAATASSHYSGRRHLHRRRRSNDDCDYDSIFSLGDSFADTGNNPAVFAWYSIFDPVTRPPYGSTFFGLPTGRNCDGRLILDFIAEGLELPYVSPYLGPPFAAAAAAAPSPSPADDDDYSSSSNRFRHGASFAVGAATALNVEFFRERDIPGDGSEFPLNITLGVQLEWFEAMKLSLCRTTPECKEQFGRSLFVVGEFGVNDYHFSFATKNVSEVRSYVPLVVRTISMVVERLIGHGATNLVVPGVIPSGCSPPVLAMFPDAGPEEIDARTGCLTAPNELGRHHNALLQASLRELRAKHRHVRIVYADFFNPVMAMVESPQEFGFREDVLTVCCGNGSFACGDPDAPMCPDPSASLYWDGVHFTEAANRYIAAGWLASILNRPTGGGEYF